MTHVVDSLQMIGEIMIEYFPVQDEILLAFFFEAVSRREAVREREKAREIDNLPKIITARRHRWIDRWIDKKLENRTRRCTSLETRGQDLLDERTVVGRHWHCTCVRAAAR